MNRKMRLPFPCCRYFCQPPIDIDNDDDDATLGLDYTVPPLSAEARNILCGRQMMSQDRSCPQKVTTWEDCLELGVNSSIVGPSCPHTWDSPLCLPSSPSKPSKCKPDRSLFIDVETVPICLPDPQKWSFAQALVISLASGVLLILVVTLAGCGVITRAYRRASRHIRRLIVKSLPSLTDDVEMAVISGGNNSAKSVSKTGRPDKGKKRWQKIRFRRSEKKKKKSKK